MRNFTALLNRRSIVEFIHIYLERICATVVAYVRGKIEGGGGSLVISNAQWYNNLRELFIHIHYLGLMSLVL